MKIQAGGRCRCVLVFIGLQFFFFLFFCFFVCFFCFQSTTAQYFKASLTAPSTQANTQRLCNVTTLQRRCCDVVCLLGHFSHVEPSPKEREGWRERRMGKMRSPNACSLSEAITLPKTSDGRANPPKVFNHVTYAGRTGSLFRIVYGYDFF